MALQIANMPQGVSPNKGLSLHLWTFIPLSMHAHVYTPGKGGLECINTAKVVVWEGKHCDPDTQVIHLSTLR